jgi:hypothetical protein
MSALPRRVLTALTALLVAGAAAWPHAAQATDRALLIGVSDYPALPRRLWLNGPVNDVALMRQTLLGRGFEASNIQALVSRTGPANEPTRANILAALAQAVQVVQAGDRVVFYLSGHGSQQPQPQTRGTRPAETDGLDEVFLPADVGVWNGQTSRAAIPNALLDDEIGEWMDAVVDKGALVWGIFDTCHAAGMSRGGRVKWRSVASAELGLTVTDNAAAPSHNRPTTAQRSDGRTLAFAARSHELTGEEWLPRGGSPRTLRIHGVFTFHLAQAWAQGAGIDTQALEAALRAKYQQELRLRPTPVMLGLPSLAWP